MNTGGLLTLLCPQELVPRRERQPAALPHDLPSEHLDREVQIPRHPSDDGQLLPVLLSERGHVRFHYVEELGDDRGDPAEEVRASSRTEAAGETLDDDEGVVGVRRSLGLGNSSDDVGRVDVCVAVPLVAVALLPRRTEVERLGLEDRLDSSLGQRAAVGLPRPRVAPKVLVGSELRRIDVDRDDNDVCFALGAGEVDEGEVAGVEAALCFGGVFFRRRGRGFEKVCRRSIYPRFLS